MGEIGSASFGLVVGLGRFRQQLAEGERIGERSGKKTGEKLGDGVESGLRSKMGGIKAAAASVAAAAGGAMVMGISDTLEAEALDGKLAASLNLDPTEAKAAGDIAGRLWAGAWGDSLAEVNGAVASVMSSLGEFTSSDADIEKATAHALDFAKAFDQDVNTAVGNAGILLQTGLAKDADHAFDLMTAGMQQVPVAFRDELGEATREYSQFFAGLGFSGEEAMGILAEASKGGQYVVDKVGDSLKELRIRAADGSKATSDAYSALGLNATQMATDIASGGDKAQAATQAIVESLLAVEDPAEKGQLAVALFGAPFEDITGDGARMDQVLKSLAAGGLTEVEGRATKMGEALNDNAKTNLTAYGRSLRQDVANIIEGDVLPAIDSLPGPLKATVVGFGAAASGAAGMADTLGPAVMAMRGLGDPAKNAGSKLLGAGKDALKAGANVAKGAGSMAAAGTKAAASAVASGAKTSAAWITAGTKTAASAISSAAKTSAAWVASGTKAAASAVSAGAKVAAQWAMMGAKALLGAAKVAAAWLISIGPVLLVGAVIAGLVYLVVKHWDTIKRWTGAAWDWVWNKIKGVIGFVKNLFLNFTGPGLLIKHWDTIKSGVRSVTDFFRDKWEAVISWFSTLPTTIGNTAKDIGSTIITKIGEGISGMTGFVGDVAGRIWSAIKDFINSRVADPIRTFEVSVSNGLGGYLYKGKPFGSFPRFHTGGVYSAPTLGGEGLALLRDGEGIFTREQMSHLAPVVNHKAVGPPAGSEVIRLVLDGRVVAEVVRDRQEEHDRRNGRGSGRRAA